MVELVSALYSVEIHLCDIKIGKVHHVIVAARSGLEGVSWVCVAYH